MMFNNGMGYGGGMWLFGILMFVALFMLFKAMSTNDSGSNNTSTESALDVLKKRYALGEIDEEEFERRKKTLDE